MGQAPMSRRGVGSRKPCQVSIHLQGLGSSQLADHLVNVINQGPCYVNVVYMDMKNSVYIPALTFISPYPLCYLYILHSTQFVNLWWSKPTKTNHQFFVSNQGSEEILLLLQYFSLITAPETDSKSDKKPLSNNIMRLRKKYCGCFFFLSCNAILLKSQLA